MHALMLAVPHSQTTMTSTPQYDRFLAGFIIGKVFGLTLTFAQRVFGLIVGAAVIAMVYLGATAGLEALVHQVLAVLQGLVSKRVLAAGLAAGFISALAFGPALAGQSETEVR